MEKHRFSKVIIIDLFVILLIIANPLYALNNLSFPYAKRSSSTKLTVSEKKNSLANGPRGFNIAAGSVEGEAEIHPVQNTKEAQQLVDAQMIGVTSTFSDNPAPYPGHITSTINCWARKHLHEKKHSFAGHNTKVILAVSGERRIFGSCAKEHIKYAALVWSGYDKKQKQVVTVKLYKPIQDILNIEGAQKELLQVFQDIVST